MMSPGDGTDSSFVVQPDPQPAVEPLGRVREYHPLHCRTPWSRTSTLGGATTGGSGAGGNARRTHLKHRVWRLRPALYIGVTFDVIRRALTAQRQSGSTRWRPGSAWR